MADQIVPVELPSGRVERLSFPEEWNDEQIQNGIHQFIGQETDQPYDVPAAKPPEGVTHEQSELKTFSEEFKREIPKMVGGLTLPLAAFGKTAQMAPVAKSAALTAAAGLGGAGGEAYQTIYEWVTKQETAPKSPDESAKRIAMAGGEEALWELTGQSIFKLLQKLGSAMKPTIDPYMKELYKSLEKAGGHLTLPQMSDSKFIKFFGGISEHSIFGGSSFKTARKAQEKAVDRITGNMSKAIAKKSTDMSDQAIGELFLDASVKGRKAHTAAGQVLYNQLDTLIGQKEVVKNIQKEVSSNIIDSSGQPLTRMINESVQTITDNAPVNLKTIKQAAKEQLSLLERQGNIAGEEQVKLLNTIASRPDKMLFSDANAIRSDLLTVTREMEDKLGAGKAKSTANKYMKLMTEAMDTAAKNSKDPAIIASYERANKFWSKGKEIFDNKFIGDLIVANKKQPARIGETIFRTGNVQEIVQTKKALRASAKLNKEVDYEKVWSEMQSGYLETLLHATKDTKSHIVRSSPLQKLFLDRKKNRTLKAAFSKDQIDSIKKFTDMVQAVESKPDSKLGMLIQLTQAGAAGMVLTMNTGGLGDNALGAGTILLGPAVIARIMTRPKLMSSLVHASKMQASLSSEAAKKFAVKLSANVISIMNEVDEANSEIKSRRPVTPAP